jgi:hypothetical protein
LTFSGDLPIVEAEGTEVKDDAVASAPVAVPSFDDPEIEFGEADDHPMAYKAGAYFDVLPDRTLKPSRLAVEDILFRTFPMSKDDAVALALERSNW